MVLEQLHIHMQKNEVGWFLILQIEINSEWIKDLKLENKGGNLYNTRSGNGFLDRIPKAQIAKEWIHQNEHLYVANDTRESKMTTYRMGGGWHYL